MYRDEFLCPALVFQASPHLHRHALSNRGTELYDMDFRQVVRTSQASLASMSPMRVIISAKVFFALVQRPVMTRRRTIHRKRFSDSSSPSIYLTYLSRPNKSAPWPPLNPLKHPSPWPSTFRLPSASFLSFSYLNHPQILSLSPNSNSRQRNSLRNRSRDASWRCKSTKACLVRTRISLLPQNKFSTSIKRK